MKLFTRKKCLFILMMVVSVSIVLSGQQLMKTKPLVLKSLVTVDLVSTAKYYVGVCPVTVKMTGVIKVPKAMTIKYNFLRSDGATAKMKSIIFKAAGTRKIDFNWKLGKDGMYWVQLIVKTTSSVIKSGKMGFQVKCDKLEAIAIKPIHPKQLVVEPNKISRSIKVTYPNGGETFIYMRHHENNYIKWKSANIGKVNIWLVQGDKKVHEIGMGGLGEGGSWYCGYDGIEGIFYPGTDFKIRVESLDGKVWDESDDFFTIQ